MTRAKTRTSLAAAAGLALAVGFGPAAMAQEQFSEEKLQTFVVAMLQVQEIGQAAQPRFEAAETAEQRQQLEAEVVARMVQAVEDSGLTVEEYQEIAAAAQSDPDVARQISEQMQQQAQ